MPARRLMPLLLALLAALLPAAAAADASPTAEVTVSIDRMVYVDGYYRASFSTAGACAPANDAVQVLASTCGDPAVQDASSGTVRMVKLGFDASRRVDAGRADLPLLETGQAGPVQWDRVILRVHEAGAVRVEITGEATGGFDPQPVAGTASSGGTISGRSVIWTLPDAAPGTYGFGAQFMLGAPTGFAGTFVPRVTVTRTVSGARLLDHVGAPPPPMWPVAVQRTSTLVMPQHIAPAYGPPVAGIQPYIGTREAFPAAFETEAWLDASGAYNALGSGVVQAASKGPIEEIAPEAVGVINSAAIFASRPWIPGADKVRAFPTIHLNDGEIVDFDHTVSTATPTTLEIPVPQGPTAGTFWEGDTAIVGAAATISEVSADREGEPDNDVGVVAADWKGNTSTAWSGLWANNVPGGEPNALNYAKYKRDVENAALGAAGYPGGYGPYPMVAITAASIPVVALGGDIDNRGDSLLEGEPFTVRMPAGHSLAGAITFTVWMPKTKYKFTQAGTGTGLSITPQVDSGGVWLESTEDGYDRDWANLHMVMIFSTELGRAVDGGLHTSSVLVVPEGARGALDVLDAEGGSLHRTLTPGEWRVTLSPEGLDLARLGDRTG